MPHLLAFDHEFELNRLNERFWGLKNCWYGYGQAQKLNVKNIEISKTWKIACCYDSVTIFYRRTIDWKINLAKMQKMVIETLKWINHMLCTKMTITTKLEMRVQIWTDRPFLNSICEIIGYMDFHTMYKLKSAISILKKSIRAWSSLIVNVMFQFN